MTIRFSPGPVARMDSGARSADAAVVDHARHSAVAAEHGVDIGRVDYQIRHTCHVLPLLDHDHRHGIGSRVLDRKAGTGATYPAAAA